MHLLLRLLLAHLISDYYLQFEGWAQEKSLLKGKSVKFRLHVLFTFLSAYAFTFSVLLALSVTIFHALIDFLKMQYGQNKVRTLLLDQSLHLFSLLIVFFVFKDLDWIKSSVWTAWLSTDQLVWVVLITLFSYPFAMFQYIVLYPLSGGKKEYLNKYIGIAERILIITSFATGLWPYLLPLLIFKVVLMIDNPERKYRMLATFLSVIPTFLLCCASEYAMEAF